MTISTRGRYGLRAMLVLALRYDSGPVAAQQIAGDQGFSVKYLEALLGSLKRAGLIIATRGKTGGYALARHPAQITLYDVLSPLEDSLDVVHCTEDNSCCARTATCVTRDVWRQIKEVTERHLKGATLDDLRRRQVALLRKRPRAGVKPGRPSQSPPVPPRHSLRRTDPRARRRSASTGS
ncbi:MAG: Rrf2 family transcriptional regulator [Acidobacteriota bacterium]